MNLDIRLWIKKWLLQKLGIYAEKIKKIIKERRMLNIFKDELNRANSAMVDFRTSDLPSIFERIPLDVFGKLLLDVPEQYANIKSFFPSMASEEIQRNWTGSHGETLLRQSLAFIKTLTVGYADITGKKIRDAVVLDYGCGWGRLLRLLYKYVPIENIYGVDPWDESINICKNNGVKGNLALSDYVPITLPFEKKFDLIFAFSVFTHLSEKTAFTVLTTLREYISAEGVLALTIRPKEYWAYHKDGILASKMLPLHERTGFAFEPHKLKPINGDITYGDASISLEFIEKNFPNWKIARVEWGEIDPYQVIVFLQPV
jgi:2-polyprenyl-3-methyl-5-hydroxy-6-metoxy-1,4-benzoquinol methylase